MLGKMLTALQTKPPAQSHASTNPKTAARSASQESRKVLTHWGTSEEHKNGRSSSHERGDADKRDGDGARETTRRRESTDGHRPTESSTATTKRPRDSSRPDASEDDAEPKPPKKRRTEEENAKDLVVKLVCSKATSSDFLRAAYDNLLVGQYTACVVLCDHVYKTFSASEFGDLLLVRGQARWRLGMMEEAKRDFENWIKSEPGHPFAAQLRAEFSSAYALYEAKTSKGHKPAPPKKPLTPTKAPSADVPADHSAPASANTAGVPIASSSGPSPSKLASQLEALDGRPSPSKLASQLEPQATTVAISHVPAQPESAQPAPEPQSQPALHQEVAERPTTPQNAAIDLPCTQSTIEAQARHKRSPSRFTDSLKRLKSALMTNKGDDALQRHDRRERLDMDDGSDTQMTVDPVSEHAPSQSPTASNPSSQRSSVVEAAARHADRYTDAAMAAALAARRQGERRDQRPARPYDGDMLKQQARRQRQLTELARRHTAMLRLELAQLQHWHRAGAALMSTGQRRMHALMRVLAATTATYDAPAMGRYGLAPNMRFHEHAMNGPRIPGPADDAFGVDGWGPAPMPIDSDGLMFAPATPTYFPDPFGFPSIDPTEF